MGSFLVSHPHCAVVASGVAAALEREGQLALYATGLAAVPAMPGWRLIEGLGRRLPELRNRIVRGVEPAHLRALCLAEVLTRSAVAVSGALGFTRPSMYDALFVSHDAVVASIPWPSDVSAIYAYEDGALRTFERARRKGMSRVWDLPLPHYATLDRMWKEEIAAWPDAASQVPGVRPTWKTRRKDAELDQATVISVASSFTRSSLVSVSVNAPIVVAPYGFPVDAFRMKERPQQGPFTVLSVGTHDLRKGTPYLLEAWKRAGLQDARLRLVGALKLAPTFLRRYEGLFEHVSHVPRVRLEAEYQAADLLAFPTLGDGFGLVIQEAMSCGTPVVTTRCGGGPECISPGVEGWIVPERSVDALVECLRVAARDRDRTREMGKAARRRAEQWTWREAGAHFVAQLSRHVE